MSDKFTPRFIKGIMHTGVGTFASIVMGFLCLLVAVRFVSKDQFGVYILFQVISSFFVMICDFGQNLSTTKFIVSSEEVNRKELISTVILSRLCVVLVLCIFILLIKPLLLLIFKSELLSKLFIYLPVFFFITSIHELLFAIMQGLHIYKKMAVVQIARSSLRFLLILFFLVYLKLDVMGLIYAYIISYIFAICLQYFLLPIKIYFKLSLGLFNKMFAFAFPLGLNNILSFIFLRVDTLMIGALVSPLGVAYYEVASKIPSSCRQMYQSFRTVYFPSVSELFAQGRKEQAEKVLNNSLRLVSFVTMFAALVATVFQKDIVRILFTEQYLDCAPALTLLMVSLSIGLIGNIMGTSLVAAGHSDKPVKINLVDTILNVASNLILIPVFGFMGAVYATLISRCFTNPVIVLFLKRSSINVRIIEYIKPILLFSCFCVPLYIFDCNYLIIKFIYVLLFPVFSMYFLILTKKDFSILFNKTSSHQAT